MRLPVNDEFVLSALVPTLDDHEPFPVTRSDALAAGYLRSYQRTRRRSYAERGIGVRPGIDWDQLHYPVDPLSYQLTAFNGRLFKHAQQIRFFRREGGLHEKMLGMLCRLRMLDERHCDLLLERAAETEVVCQIGGWVARSSDSSNHAAFLPYFCWALTYILQSGFAYAPCRVENGAARFLQRIGAEPLSEPEYSSFYGGEVQLMGFYRDGVVKRHRPLFHQAMDILEEKLSVCLGTRTLGVSGAIEFKDALFRSTRIRPGGQLVTAEGGEHEWMPAERERRPRVA